MIRIYKTIEQRPKILGLAFQEIGLLTLLFTGLLVGGAIAKSFIQVSGWYYVFIILFTLTAYFILRIGNAKNHPSFLFSTISHWLQPKEILMDHVSFKKVDTQDL